MFLEWKDKLTVKKGYCTFKTVQIKVGYYGANITWIICHDLEKLSKYFQYALFIQDLKFRYFVKLGQ